MTRIIAFIIIILALDALAMGVVYLACYLIKKQRALGLALIASILLLTGYNVYDNNRLVVRSETVYIAGLPSSFDGFRILQVSDLHGKSFGAGQAELADLINRTGHDMIAFTGDMETRDDSFAPFLALLERLEDKSELFYVNGNYPLAYDFLTGRKTRTGLALEDAGCIILTEPAAIVRDGETLWLVGDLSKAYREFNAYKPIPRFFFPNADRYEAYQEYFARLNNLSAGIRGNRDIKIALAHIPLSRRDIEKPVDDINRLDYDLILAGHYHGGQIRIPFYGALFVPITDPWTDSFLPAQEEVSGLLEYADGVQQYVSRGLGASNIPFRLFNTPEINLITLRSR